MTTKTTVLLVGVCVGVTLPLIRKVARPLGAYAVAGGMIAYEAACELVETSGEAVLSSIRRLREGPKPETDR